MAWRDYSIPWASQNDKCSGEVRVKAQSFEHALRLAREKLGLDSCGFQILGVKISVNWRDV